MQAKKLYYMKYPLISAWYDVHLPATKIFMFLAKTGHISIQQIKRNEQQNKQYIGERFIFSFVDFRKLYVMVNGITFFFFAFCRLYISKSCFKILRTRYDISKHTYIWLLDLLIKYWVNFQSSFLLVHIKLIIKI